MCAHGMRRQDGAANACPNARVRLCEPSRHLRFLPSNHFPATSMIDQPRRERMFNVPAAILVLLIVLGLIQAVLMFVLTAEQTTEFLLLFAFIPARYDASMISDIAWPGGWRAGIWTFVTFGIIMHDQTHLHSYF